MDTTYKMTLLAGTSTEGYEQAVMNAIDRAGRTLKGPGLVPDHVASHATGTIYITCSPGSRGI